MDKHTDPTNTPLSSCHGAPVVVCEGTAWDVPPESIKKGSTYWYGCTECKQACDLYVAPPTLKKYIGNAQPGDDDTNVTISLAPTDTIAGEELDKILNEFATDDASDQDANLASLRQGLLAWRDRSVDTAVIAELEKLRLTIGANEQTLSADGVHERPAAAGRNKMKEKFRASIDYEIRLLKQGGSSDE